MPVNTAKVKGRRVLRFESLQEILDDVNGLAGREVRTLGNWTFPQILEHLARVMDSAIDGMDFKVNWLIRAMAKMMRKRMLNSPMPPGFKLPEKARSIVPADDVPLEEALSHFRRSIKRLKETDERAPSPVFGPMSLEDSEKMQCRHAELHLSFVVPVEEAAALDVRIFPRMRTTEA